MSKQPPQVQFNFEPDAIEDEKISEIDYTIEDEIEEAVPKMKLPDISKQKIIEEDVFEYPDNIGVLPDSIRANLETEFMEEGKVFKDKTKVAKTNTK